MKHYLLDESDYRTGKWVGGETKELAIFPAESEYIARNFIWRISSATVDAEKSDFSVLPDYDRVIMVLDGEVVLSYEGERVTRLQELEQDRFDGAWKTKSFGRITDFNLMVRKGNEGYVNLIHPELTAVTYKPSVKTGMPLGTHALYCKDGYAIVTWEKETFKIDEGQLLVMEFTETEAQAYSVMGEGLIIRSEIYYKDMREELGPEIIKSEPATFEDFKKCIFLANVQFRGARYIVKGLKDLWLDETLRDIVNRLEKLFVTFWIFILGVVGICLFSVNKGFNVGIGAGILLVWIIIDCILVSPLVYFIFVPKPVAKHIKNVNELTPYEKKVRDEELLKNERLDKLMKKYKNSGRNLGK